jgi:sodium/bile acid cotransporter 7
MSFTLPFDRLSRAAGNARAIGLSTAACFLLLPGLCFLVSTFLYPEDAATAAGFALLGALPSTLASAAVWTRIAGGNDAVPLVFTALSNALAFLVMPAILLVTLSRWLPVDAAALGGALALRVLAPVAAGQVLRAILPRLAERLSRPISVAARILVLAIILVAVSKAADTFRDRPLVAAGIVAVTALVHGVALVATQAAATRIGLTKEDAIGVVFGGTQKSLYVGVWIAAAWYPDLPGALVPILGYHVAQLVVDTGVASRYAVRHSQGQ